MRALILVLSCAAFAGADGSKKPEPMPAGTILVLNKSGNSMSLVDRASGVIVGTLPTENGPHEVAVSPDGKTAVATNYGVRGKPGRTLTVYDLPARKRVKTIDLGKYRQPHGIVYLPDGVRVAVTAEASQALLVVDVKNGTIEKAVGTDAKISHMVALGPGGKRAYVANIFSHSMTVIDLEKGERIKHVPTGRGAEGIAVRPTGAEIWVTNRAADTVSIVDAKTLAVVANIACPRFPIRIAFTNDGKHALVSCALSGDVAVIDAVARKVEKRMSMRVAELEKDDKGTMFGRRRGPMPIGLTLSADGRHGYVASGGYDRLSVIDLKSFSTVARYKTGREPDGLAFTPLTLRPHSGR